MNDHIFKTGRILGVMVMLALLTGLFCLPVLAADNLGGGRKVIPPAVVDPATGESLVFIASDWKTYHPFAERYLPADQLQAAGDHVIDLAAFQFATDRLVSKDRAGRKSFAYPDLGSFQPSLVKRPFTAGTWDYFIVQADSPDGQTALRQHLEQSGIAILGYLPRLAYLVRLDTAGWKALEQRPEVYWMGLYQPAFRIYPKLEWIIEADPIKELEFTAHFDPLVYPEFENLFDVLSRINLDITDYDHTGDYWLVRFAGEAQQVRALAAVPGCFWVERFVPHELHNNIARTSANTTTGRGATAGPIMDVEDVWARGIRGEGQIASASDTGLSTGNLATLHQDYGQQGSSTNPMRVIKGYALGRTTWDDNQTTGGGHGTHTSGSIVGNGFRSGSTPNTNTFPSTCFAGTAPKAQFVFQSVMDSSGGLGGIPADLNNLFSPPYADGARVHSNSWGAALAGQYSTDSSNLDRFAWNNKDMVITFSAGNSGRDTGGTSGVIDTDSIGSPGTAKNCITVGASENYRPDFVYEYPENDCTGTAFTQVAWGWFNGTNFGREPIYSDPMANNANGMGAFSSRGPCDDGRIKPDITAPGIAIISTRTDLNQAYEQWGICNVPTAQRPYYVNMGGTSMSNPLTAGASTLVRQYYVDGWHPNNSSTTNSSAVPVDGFNPSSALVKATLINGAWDMNPGQYGTGTTRELPPDWDTGRDLPNNAEGFGRVDLEHSLFPGSGWGDDASRKLAVYDVTPGLQTGQTHTYTFYIANANDPLIVTLVWTDPWAAAASGTRLINNMDLEVYAPGGTRYYPNRKDWTGGTQDSINNVEQVYVSSPASGEWSITVRGTNVPGNGTSGTNTQPYALVMSGVSCLALAAPTGVTATTNGNNSILVDWNSVSGAVQYKVYRSTTSGGPYSLLSTVSAPTTDYSDNNLSGGFTYYYVVTSYGSGSSACDSGYSVEASATVQGACNLPPMFNGLGSVSAPGGTGCTLELSWDAAIAQCSGPVTYSIYRSTSTGFTPSLSNRIAVGITGTTYQDTDGLLPATTYYYVVRATDESNGVSESNTVEQSGMSTGPIVDTTWSAGAESGDPTLTMNGLWSISSTRRHSGTYSYFSGYSNNLCANVRTPSLTLTAGQSSTLSFWTAFNIQSRYDGGVVEISTNGGSSWTQLTPTPGYPSTFRNSADACGYATGVGCFTGNNLTWNSYSVSLSSYNGLTIIIRFNFSTDGNTVSEGWYVDDISITHVAQLGACTGTPADVVYLTATATNESNKLEWVNPAGSYTTTRIRYRT
ncbi:MAG TPA: S8 family serine peptidase, partial [Acidobacteriota bacterium]|nr:S8 family serine peptidase [Acidobacteriota bacterium]